MNITHTPDAGANLDDGPLVSCPIVVIGAGPAGLSLGHELGRRGLEFIILEQSDAPASSWSRMPRNMTLNSPWKASALAGARVGWRGANRILPRSEFHRYLVEFAESGRLPIRTGTPVREVRRAPAGGFVVRCERGGFRCRVVLNATGYFRNPVVPTYPGLDASRVQRMHVCEYVDPVQARALTGRPDGRILIVGSRISAGQVALELHDAGFDVSISHRSPLVFMRPPWLKQLSFTFYFFVEDKLLRYTGYNEEDSFGHMQGGRVKRLIRSGRIHTVPAIERLHERSIRFAGGAERDFDLIIWCTGFRPALAHLNGLVNVDPRTGTPPVKAFESVEAPGLYFIGVDQLRDFTSRMLRGIRRDAASLADLLAAQGNGS